MSVPNKTGTDGALVVPLTARWKKKAAPEQSKKAVLYADPILGSIETVPIYPTMETAPMASPTSQRPTIINPLDFMRGNPYE